MANAVAADVPGRFDLVINGNGYLLLDALQPLIPWRSARAKYSYSPTFLDRSNVGSAYGDNAQDFFLTASQNNWDLGEDQRFFRAADPDRSRRYWYGTNVDPVSIPGQVTMRQTTPTLTFAEAIVATAEDTSGVYGVGATTLYQVVSAGTISSKGAHGLGATPSKWGLATDGKNVYVSTTAAGTVGVRKYNGSVWSTFSASAADSLCYLNNSLYGYSESAGSLVRWDTAGNQSTLYVWKDASGTGLSGSNYSTRLRQFGGTLLMLRTLGSRRQGELWRYDGTSTSELGDFPANFVACDIEEVEGIAYITGYTNRAVDKLPTIYYYVNGAIGVLWKAVTSGYTNTTWPAVAGWGDGIAFTDDTTGSLRQYTLSTGGVHTIGTYTVTNATPMMAANKDILVHTRNSTTGYYYPTSSLTSTATLVTSLFDFDNSLTKNFRGIKIDFDIPAGSTASFDIAYQVDSVDGSWTTLQTGAVSGTEYPLGSSVSGRAIAVRVTFNLGNAATSPRLKRVYVRAAPILQTYPLAEYVIEMTGAAGATVRMCRDGTPHPATGAEQMAQLITAVQSTAPIQITDRVNGTFTGVIDPGGLEVYEEHPAIEEIGSGSGTVSSGAFVARVSVRGV